MSSSYLDQRIVAVKPIAVPAPDRGIDLQVKVTAPLSGQNLPVIVFSHGNAWSLDGYEPLVDRWAAAGFVVVQPTHLDSRRNGLGWDDPRFATVWRVRIADLHAVLDGLDDILLQAGGLETRVDRGRTAIVGHSWGAQTVGALLGARVLDADGIPGEDFSHSAVAAGALIAATGTGDTLTPFAAEHLPFMRPDYSTMTTPALVVAGGKDRSQLSTRGPEWFTDAYRLSPSPKSLLTIAEGEHTLGGIAGEMVAETTDEDPARVALVADAVSAYLLDALKLNSAAWTALDNATEAGDSTWSISSK
ncbi:alpha/beta fold hydrolase (plasmid) [Streptomyces sp. NBC_00053]|uniref:alpha/beta hydrolase family protein n=1 Tax=unclassified Streptomyces TaxID=2593676 RepID=UPI000F5BAC2D|nr:MULTISPECIES: alpha/beta fold hydrolase [unclassified Streptomyces]WSG56265.1 alpha/beta fold hydrolase [Streptomyces sp. NBC_01732]MCX5505756.1 alpha/beta fold hydrolase [Streptomyces sp. NBC_00052]MCX5553781.1 alpha/beta fold hydrolase [Streptomyces sp. NBC_00051]RPK57040.1 Alpha/beta hydrolase family protein [Streptomyces sp. ADI95-17]WSP52629.1 alpha/beta fold hydrolase [Streptomyces sp. NBC_01243]